MEQIIIDRRALHRIPELDRDLDRTMAYLRGALQGLRCRLFSPIPNSLCAFFDNESDSAIAFRCGC
ncbi:MAG: amidohydrolase, partial [Aristaeellaceae bacterium]